MAEDEKVFLEDLINFYKASVMGTAESVKKLAEIEENFPITYGKFKKATFDPENIESIMTSMTEEQKEIFLIIFTKVSFIAKKLNQLFEMPVDEKKKLAKEIEDFMRYMEKKLSELRPLELERAPL